MKIRQHKRSLSLQFYHVFNLQPGTVKVLVFSFTLNRFVHLEIEDDLT